MRVTVYLFGGKPLDYNVSDDATVLQLKEEILKSLGISTKNQVLTEGCIKLLDSEKLSDINPPEVRLFISGRHDLPYKIRVKVPTLIHTQSLELTELTQPV